MTSKTDLDGVKVTEKVSIPAFILRDRSVAVLESITEYLKDEKGLTYHEIAVLLNRDDRTIWTVYNRAKKKRDKTPVKKEVYKKKLVIPAKIFRDRNVSVLEATAEYLKKEGMTYHEIAEALNRDDRTIWTVCYRAKKKRENEQ